ncbi:hypothetical protein SS50377_25591 [Spironucleus salmonicida]|uniref:Uncharacterized protein n=1 Tax=Spironucleus salmonicida TaxID=348837 RepID=A0A9P8RYA6_9EUKA|nr:hypothetical protein SS50377_25591 [Spironucleus salmonicida]
MQRLVQIEIPQPVGIKVITAGDVVQIQSSEQAWSYKNKQVNPNYNEHLGLCLLLQGYLQARLKNDKSIELIKKSIELVPNSFRILSSDLYLMAKAYIFENNISGVPNMLSTKDLDEYSISYTLATTEALFIAGQYYKLAVEQLQSQKLKEWCQQGVYRCQEKVIQTGIYSIFEQAPNIAYTLSLKLKDKEQKAYLQNIIKQRLTKNVQK